jgi:hypothetical protein
MATACLLLSTAVNGFFIFLIIDRCVDWLWPDVIFCELWPTSVSFSSSSRHSVHDGISQVSMTEKLMIDLRYQSIKALWVTRPKASVFSFSFGPVTSQLFFPQILTFPSRGHQSVVIIRWPHRMSVTSLSRGGQSGSESRRRQPLEDDKNLSWELASCPELYVDASDRFLEMSSVLTWRHRALVLDRSYLHISLTDDRSVTLLFWQWTGLKIGSPAYGVKGDPWDRGSSSYVSHVHCGSKTGSCGQLSFFYGHSLGTSQSCGRRPHFPTRICGLLFFTADSWTPGFLGYWKWNLSVYSFSLDFISRNPVFIIIEIAFS